MTFKGVPKKVVTVATKVKARVVSEEGDSQEQRIRRGSRKPPGTIPRSSLFQGRGFWELFWAKVLLRIHLFH
jgi:hypothetical protein